MSTKVFWVGAAVVAILAVVAGGQRSGLEPVAAQAAANGDREEFVRTCVAVELAQTSDQFITSDDVAPFAQLCGEIFERQGGREWFFGRLQATNPQLAQTYRGALLP